MSVGAIFLALIVGVVACVLGEDAKTLVPRLSDSILRRASKRLAQDIRDDFLEEWLAHLHETTELTGKLWHAISVLLWGAARVDSEARRIEFASQDFKPDYAKRAYDVTWGALILSAYCLPSVFVLIALWASGSPTLVCRELVGRGGRPIRIWMFPTRTPVNWLNWLIEVTSIKALPACWSLFNGDLSLVGPALLSREEAEKIQDPRFFELRPGIVEVQMYDGDFAIVKKGSKEGISVAAAKYRERRSLWLDVKLTFAVIKHVLMHGRGS